MTPDARRLAASTGKSVVAATMLSLATEDVLRRGDLLADYPGGRDRFERPPNHDTITIGHLLRHEGDCPASVVSWN